MRRRSVLPAAPALALLLAGCGGGPEGLAAMRADLAREIAPAAASAGPRAPVPDRFDAALRAAVAADPSYRAARAREAEAMAAIGGAEAAWRPQLSGNATLGALREGDPVSDTTTGAAGDLTLSQLLYDGGAAGGAIDRARAEALAAEAARAAEANAAALAAAEAWIDLWQFDTRLALLDSRTRALDDLVAQIERMATNGMLDRAAHDAARRQIADVQLMRTEMQAGRDAARTRFTRHFGPPPARLAKPAGFADPAALGRLADGWRKAPALRQAAAELLAARAAEREAQAAFRPRVAVQAGVTSPMDEDETTDVTAGLRLSYTFGDGGRRKAALRAAGERVTALEAALQAALGRAEDEMRVASDRRAALARALPVVERKIALSGSEAGIARSQIVTGQSSLRQLVAAEIESYRARDEQIRMQCDMLKLELSILAGTGALTGAIGLDG